MKRPVYQAVCTNGVVRNDGEVIMTKMVKPIKETNRVAVHNVEFARPKVRKEGPNQAIRYIRSLKRKEFELLLRLKAIKDELKEISLELDKDFEYGK